MAVFNTGSGPSSQDIGQYVSFNWQASTVYFTLHAGFNLGTEITSISG